MVYEYVWILGRSFSSKVGLKYLIVDMSFTRRGKNIYLFMCLYEVGEEGGGETASMASSGENWAKFGQIYKAFKSILWK